MALGIGIGIPFIRVSRGAAIDAQAQAHFDRVIADGGLVPSGLSGVNAFFTTIKTIYGTSDITTAISVGLDAQVLGYKLGAGAGTTAGQAAQKLYSCSGASGDVVQTTAASQPLLLVHSGENYWFVPAAAGNFVSTPNVAANALTNDIDVKVKVKVNLTNVDQITISKFATTGNQRQFAFFLTSANTLRFRVCFDGITSIDTYTSTSTQPFTAGQIGWWRFTRNKTTGVGTFFTSTDGITWTQLGTTFNVSAGVSLFASTADLTIGNTTTSATGFSGEILRAEISNTIDGAATQIFNPNQYNAATSQTQWTSSTGEVWTINTGTATTGYKGVLVDRTIMQGDGVDDRLTSGTLASRQYFTSYAAQKLYVYNTTDKPIYSGSTDSHILYGNTSIYLFNGAILMSGNTSTLLNASTLDFNNTNSKIRVNAGADVTGAGGTKSSTTTNIFSYSGTFGNAILNTLIQSSGINNNTTKTAMYDYIKSINNNAF